MVCGRRFLRAASVVLLIVAADESINLQTREHVSIMSLLGQKRGIIVLTKSDKADADMRALVTEEVKALVKGTFLETAPVIPESTRFSSGTPGPARRFSES